MTPALVPRVRGRCSRDARRRTPATARRGRSGCCTSRRCSIRRIDTLSKGYRRRVGLAQAILHDPEVLILDEPTDGLDPNQKHEVRELIGRMAKSKIIVISTHMLEEVEAVCNRAIIIAQGRILADDTPRGLEARSRFHNAVSLKLREPGAAAFGPGRDRVSAGSREHRARSECRPAHRVPGTRQAAARADQRCRREERLGARGAASRVRPARRSVPLDHRRSECMSAGADL